MPNSASITFPHEQAVTVFSNLPERRVILYFIPLYSSTISLSPVLITVGTWSFFLPILFSSRNGEVRSILMLFSRRVIVVPSNSSSAHPFPASVKLKSSAVTSCPSSPMRYIPATVPFPECLFPSAMGRVSYVASLASHTVSSNGSGNFSENRCRSRSLTTPSI